MSAAAASAAMGKENKKPQRAFKKGIDGEEARRKREEVNPQATRKPPVPLRLLLRALHDGSCCRANRPAFVCKFGCWCLTALCASGVHRNSQEQTRGLSAETPYAR